jgi:hypothetical protein
LPFGIPGIGAVIDGAMQHAAQPLRQSIAALCAVRRPPDPLAGDARGAAAYNVALLKK